jgi:hypothetical protein
MATLPKVLINLPIPNRRGVLHLASELTIDGFLVSIAGGFLPQGGNLPGDGAWQFKAVECPALFQTVAIFFEGGLVRLNLFAKT